MEMTKRTSKKNTIQVFIVSWFPIYAKEAATIQCISRESAARISDELRQSFAAYPNHYPLIHTDRAEVRVTAYPPAPPKPGARSMARKLPTSTKTIDTITRRNWGYWDGIAARARGRYPVWAKSYIMEQRHPSDRIYGEGFWSGWYGKEPPPFAVI
jgi:hypothetical protein